jgi:putative 4-mercaptohistidine N1-methyltranferase
MAAGKQGMQSQAASYEDNEVLQQYLLFHYASGEEQFPYALGAADGLDFPLRCVERGVDLDLLPAEARALDLGCAVGRSTFELARTCREVIGIDASQAFIEAARRLQRERCHPVSRLEEGKARTALTVSLNQAVDVDRVRFEVGDAQRLRGDLGSFDVVLACNLVCRLPDPALLLDRLPNLVRPGGQLFITTPYTWLEAYTPPERWLGRAGERSFEGLRAALEPAFRLAAQFDLPFLIREHARKFQYGVAQGTRWIRV